MSRSYSPSMTYQVNYAAAFGSGCRNRSHILLMRCALGMASLGLLQSPAAAQSQILETFNDSLTTYQCTNKTLVQDLRPLVEQRGVNLDGTLRSGSLVPLALAGNPFGESWDANARSNGVNLATGTFVINDVDLAPAAPGFRWVVGRTYNCRQKDSGGSYFDSNGPMGRNWAMFQLEIRLFEGATDDKDVLYLVYGADRFIEFKRFDDTSTEFKAVNGAAGVMQFSSGGGSEPDTYTYTDQHGNQVVFFGFDNDSGVAKGQFWKMTDPAGNCAYAGDQSTGSTAITNGYNGSGQFTTVYQTLAASATRRFTYTYSGGLLASVVIAEKPSGGSFTNTGEQVEYSYYVNADSHGEDNDLKLVKVTKPLTDSGVSVVMKKGYWYFDGSYDADTNPGYPHQIKYIIDFEGFRKMDRLDSTDNDTPLTASEADMKPYASAYFGYNTSRQIKLAWFSGACGCSGGSGTGLHGYDYSTNGSFSGTSNYDTTWYARTLFTTPGEGYTTVYLDECGQPLSKVLSPGDPAVIIPAPPPYWGSYVVRNSDGQITEIRSPANLDTYTHSSGSFSGKTSGLINVFTRIASGDMKGFREDTKHKTGTGGSAYLDETLAYTSATKTVGDVTVVRPLISSRRVYSTEITSGTSGSYLTSMSYSMHSGSGVLMPKQITTTNPAVSTANNGSNGSTTSKQYPRKDGTVAFTEAADGVFNYSQFTNGLLVKSIADAQTNHGSDFASGDDPNTDFGITESGAGLRKITTYAYDSFGRLDTTTLPGGMVKKNYYSKLADHRLVHLAYNDYESGGTPKYFGPVSYTVSNHAGRSEVQATVKLTSNESTTALTGHIDETDSDPLDAMTLGTVARMSANVYDKSGGRVDESRAYHLIPGSGSGSSGTNYDATLFGYSNSGKLWRVKKPDGTIERTVFDGIGRQTARHTGTNDYSFAGGESSGPDDTIKVDDRAYDDSLSAPFAGNNNVSIRTQYIQSGSSGEREWTNTYDIRGRLILQENPVSGGPHTFNKYDNMGRLIASAQFSSAASIDPGADDPTTETANRLSLTQNFYDEMGRVWKTQRHKIDDADGSDDDNLQELRWFDSVGRLIKVDGSQLTKTAYDRLGRTIHVYTLAVDDDTGYSDADDVTGDIVLTQQDTVFDPTDDVVIMTARIDRHNTDYGGSETSGALDTNADGDDLMYTAANVKGRIQIVVKWHNRFDWLTETVNYGNYGGSDFDRDGLSVPARSDTALLTEYKYNTSTSDHDGTLKRVIDPRNLETRTSFDDAGRKTLVINNYVNGTPSSTTGDDDVHTRYEYSNGHMVTMWVDFDGDGTKDTTAPIDEVTEYTYGVIKGTNPGDSLMASGSLLQKVVYPPQYTGGGGQPATDRQVLYAYNGQGQQIWMKDQTGTIIETAYDDAGRQTHRKVTTPGSGIDTAVLRISTTYDGLGRRVLVTQYNNATPGSGTVVDEVKFTYEDWGQIQKFEQDHNSTVGASGSVDDYEVSYSYAKATLGRNTIRRSDMTMPNGDTVEFIYTPTSAITDYYHEEASRVSEIELNNTVIASYFFLGQGTVVGTYYQESDVFSYQFTPGSPGTYGALDRFNRRIDDLWTKDLGTDVNFYDVDIAFDRNSNITRTEDNVLSTGRDVAYAIDNLNRLNDADEGDWNGSSITSRTRRQLWTLDQVGNWNLNRVDLDGNGAYTGAGEMDDSRTHNPPNEITDRDLDTDGDTQYDDVHIDLVYNLRGDLTDDGETYKFVFDAFGRLRQILDRRTDTVIDEHWYNGVNFRIAWRPDTDTDGDSDSNDKKYHFACDERWRILGVFRDSDNSPKEQFVYHAAGIDGGSSYIDAVILRDRDHNTAWTSASDGTLERRDYYCQNWRADLVALVSDSGAFVEGDRYASYGTPFLITAGDFDYDGDVDSSDTTAINNMIGISYNVRADLDLDGDVDGNDYNAAVANLGTPGGRMVLSSKGNRKGYAGYELDDVLARPFYHVRHRVLDCELGRWLRRDPLGYVDGNCLFAYLQDQPMSGSDPTGLLLGYNYGNFCGYSLMASCTPSDPTPVDCLDACCQSHDCCLVWNGWMTFPMIAPCQQMMCSCVRACTGVPVFAQNCLAVFACGSGASVPEVTGCAINRATAWIFNIIPILTSPLDPLL
jgi:RHS repeat-associated protein